MIAVFVVLGILAFVGGAWVGKRLGRAEVVGQVHRRTLRLVNKEPEFDALQTALLRRRGP